MPGTVCLGLFFALGMTVAGHPAAVDMAVASAFQGWWRATPGRISQVLSDLLGIVVPSVAAIALVLALFLRLYRGYRRDASLLARIALVFGLCRLTSVLGKPLFVRARPRSYPEFAYPSGHVVAIAGTGVAAVLLCVWFAPRLTRWAVLAFGLATVVVAVTRLVLGVHWLTDTVGSVLAVLGIGLAAASVVRLLPGPVHERALPA
ncbi:phosphatase PAP2 family protein [Amycolatopsis cynarae]|uniref:Phosphatase PAP2 family protein n=1 Tax=Amycolatopsis cynarae TaxID=2995223 RepID=A0ABY7B4Y7_9PSEU|nr:phosphatase PAP2 family protein [Amycolatopsis sp. HUAS 11-8]WAL67251.1 phosphatase PAP2 family protein [Amycolatopsis sp. HUAS 11-8]